MKKIIKIILALVLLLLPVNSLATGFTDMPMDWSTEVLTKAVENGLLLGFDGKILPNKNLTRAEIATIINRSLGANKKASLSKFKDVQINEWYYDEMAKAVNMKIFKGSNNMLNPRDKISREQAFAIVARALKVEPSMKEPAGFLDLDQISSWAKGEVYEMIQAGYIEGSNNMINPKGYITRAEFAKLMDNVIKEYIKRPGKYTSLAKGNIMINCKDVVLQDLVVEGDIIIGEGVADGTLTLENVDIIGRIVERDGGDDSLKIVKREVIDNKTELKESEISNRKDVPDVVGSEDAKSEVRKVEKTKPKEIEPEKIAPEEIKPEINKPAVIGKILTVFNHAYQENYKKDSLEKIENNAKNAYILLDPDDSQAVKLIPKLKEKNNVVSAYISIGTGESWREDFNDLKPFLVSKGWDEWSGEYFVNEVNTGVLKVMKKRLDKLASLGFQWVEFDNMDWAFDDQLRKTCGFEVTAQEAISYYQELAKYADSIGLKVMAKNTTRGAEIFEGVTYESYSDNFNWWTESELKNFLAEDKIGLIVHYKESNPLAAYNKYQDIYGENILFIAESTKTREYVNFIIEVN